MRRVPGFVVLVPHLPPPCPAQALPLPSWVPWGGGDWLLCWVLTCVSLGFPPCFPEQMPQCWSFWARPLFR